MAVAEVLAALEALPPVRVCDDCNDDVGQDDTNGGVHDDQNYESEDCVWCCFH